MKTIDLGPLASPVDAVAARAIEERHELLRIAAARSLALHAQIGHLSEEDVATAKFYADRAPLQGPLGTGEPR